ncbi:hypothetical protein SDC9_180393 [bioreactor metagenome]|uniref:Uncharacterized protein n=1 Tax=bioreactor metagenome TaxID=1076179 RepID=A0A645H2K3_9ZZZZ
MYRGVIFSKVEQGTLAHKPDGWRQGGHAQGGNDKADEGKRDSLYLLSESCNCTARLSEVLRTQGIGGTADC